MVAKKGNDSKVLKRTEEKDSDHIDSELVLSIEKLQEIQDELDQVLFFNKFYSCMRIVWIYIIVVVMITFIVDLHGVNAAICLLGLFG
jgi:hypothetical protein